MGKALIVGLLLNAGLLLEGCTPSLPAGNPRQVWCDHNQPRRPSAAVVTAMTRPELDETNAFNGQGAKWCGWKP